MPERMNQRRRRLLQTTIAGAGLFEVGLSGFAHAQSAGNTTRAGVNAATRALSFVFEPNDDPLWASVRLNIGALCTSVESRTASRLHECVPEVLAHRVHPRTDLGDPAPRKPDGHRRNDVAQLSRFDAPAFERPRPVHHI
ncbi:hydrolase [Caballeronia telluris]|uniref:Hydrolase n=1 Tax=Caballeronia telluris TaxID=326475 RepID=A0A158K0D6_9BURK|nr:hydrolase [Caballeronia telluris]